MFNFYQEQAHESSSNRTCPRTMPEPLASDTHTHRHTYNDASSNYPIICSFQGYTSTAPGNLLLGVLISFPLVGHGGFRRTSLIMQSSWSSVENRSDEHRHRQTDGHTQYHNHPTLSTCCCPCSLLQSCTQFRLLLRLAPRRAVLPWVLY